MPDPAAPLPVPQPVPPAEAADALAAEDIRVSFPAPPGFDTGPSLAGRVRGALWAALEAREDRSLPASLARRRALYDLPTAAEALFSDPPAPLPRLTDLPLAPARPCLLFCEAGAGRVSVTLRAFGRGRIWLPELRPALLEALTVCGIGAWPLKSPRLRLPDGALAWSGGIPQPAALPEDAPILRLVTRTPLKLATGRYWSISARTFASSVVSRAGAVLAWGRMTLDYDPARFRADADRLDLFDFATCPLDWESHSARQDRRQSYMGLEGAFSLRGVSADMRALIALLPITGLGLHTMRGFGQVDVLPVPF